MQAGAVPGTLPDERAVVVEKNGVVRHGIDSTPHGDGQDDRSRS